MNWEIIPGSRVVHQQDEGAGGGTVQNQEISPERARLITANALGLVMSGQELSYLEQAALDNFMCPEPESESNKS